MGAASWKMLGDNTPQEGKEYQNRIGGRRLYGAFEEYIDLQHG
jgi:hypothetical protein